MALRFLHPNIFCTRENVIQIVEIRIVLAVILSPWVSLSILLVLSAKRVGHLIYNTILSSRSRQKKRSAYNVISFSLFVLFLSFLCHVFIQLCFILQAL